MESAQPGGNFQAILHKAGQKTPYNKLAITKISEIIEKMYSD